MAPLRTVTKPVTAIAKAFERRGVGIALNAVLFAVNFLIFYFLWLSVFPDITGLMRLALCWAGAYAMTWIMALLAKGAARLVLTLVFLGLLYMVLMHQPSLTIAFSFVPRG